MSPTVFRDGSFRFSFYSHEESRVHIHVSHPSGTAKFWLQPAIELATNHGLTGHQIARARDLIEEHQVEIHRAWRQYFGR